jgi:serine/threonine-protein phosphatase PGAM5
MASRFLYLLRHGEASEEGTLTASGEQQARMTGERLRGIPFLAMHHSPQPRAIRTAEIISEYLPGVPVLESGLVDDYIPSDPDPRDLPAPYATFVGTYSPQERAAGAKRARAALARFAGAGFPGAGSDGAGRANAGRAGARPADADSHELIVTHNFLIGWFVRDALGAADWRWLGLNQQNAALTIIMYRDGMSPALVSFNDAAHLTSALRWTGFPSSLTPATC